MEDFKAIEPPAKKRGFRGFFIKFLVVILLVGGVFFWWKFFYIYSDGYRVGTLQKLSHKGTMFKTYEGELILSSIISSPNTPIALEKFYFSVASDSLANVMANFEGKAMRLHYQQTRGKLPWRGESEYVVDGAEPQPE